MDSIAFLILRRMRVPLLLLSVVYAIATLGLALIPGIDSDGNPYYMGFFHAFYFVSFMGTTIGFGELPHPFTDLQRMWVICFIYITVATWIYAIGSLIGLLQNETLKRALTISRFNRQVRLIREPFFLLCGYGDTGTKLMASLQRELIPSAVLDIEQERIDILTLTDQPLFVPSLRADASVLENLIHAGILHPCCESVVALTDDNAANLHISISSKVLNPGLRVICRADSQEIEANLASFGTDHIIDPFDTFASYLSLATYAPYQFLLNDWFSREPGDPLTAVLELPRGLWILCGFGRFGRAVHREMTARGLEVRVIEPETSLSGLPANTVAGYGTEARTLTEAEVERAVGVIAGSNNDSNNLSIIVTARQLNPELYVIARQMEHSNRSLFERAEAQIIMGSSDVLANKIRSLLTNPLVDDFLSLARAQDDEWARQITEELRKLSPGRVPEVWAVTIRQEEAHAALQHINAGEVFRLEYLLLSHTNRNEHLPVLPLFHANRHGALCMPARDTLLVPEDRLLFAGTSSGRSNMQWNLHNETALHYVVTGDTPPQSSIGRWLANRRQRKLTDRIEAG